MEFRQRLRASLTALNCPSEHYLRAVYESAEPGRRDTENVLFYNVGPDAFRHLAHSGLRFERQFSTPLPAPESELAARHYHRYEPDEPGTPFMTAPDYELAAQWPELELPRSRFTVAGIWHALRCAPVDTPNGTGPLGLFGVRVTLQGGGRAGRNIAALIKKVFDGVVSALHSHNGECTDEVSRTVATELSESPATVAECLSRSDNALLGTNCLLRPFRNGVQWNPDDHKCVAGEIVFEPHSSLDVWRLAVQVHRLTRY